MKFCLECHNMLYLSLSPIKTIEGEEENDANNEELMTELVYYCRHCGHRENQNQNETIILNEKHFQDEDSKLKHIINPYTKFDPTLPRVKIPCPNQVCKSNTTSTESEVLFIRYNTQNLKYLYLCCHCDTTWKT